MSAFDSDPRTNKELLQAIEDEKQEILQRDKEMQAEGFTHRVTWWNHRTGGDDTQADMYFSADPLSLKPEDGEAYEEWRRVLFECTINSGEDYKIFELVDPGKPTEACITCGETEWLPNKTHGTWWCMACGSVKDGEQTVL